VIVVTGSEREKIQEDKIKGAILIPTHSWSPQKGELYFDGKCYLVRKSMVKNCKNKSSPLFTNYPHDFH
jgi:hypothetical protein